MLDYPRLYQYRFRDSDPAARAAVWQEIAAFVARRNGNPAVVLDPAAGNLEFLRHVPAREKWGVDLQAPRAEDLERVKTQLIAEAIYAQDNQAVLARWYGGALTTGLSIEDICSWPDRIRAVTAEQVRAAAQEWLDKKRSVTGYLIKDTATTKREEKRS